MTRRTLSRSLSPIVLAFASGISLLALTAQTTGAPSPASWYTVTVPSGWAQSAVPDGVRFVRATHDGDSVVVQLRAPVAAVVTPVQVVERLLAAIEAADGIHAPMGGEITTPNLNGRRVALVAGSYVDRAGVPVYLLLVAVPSGTSIGVLQAESRSAVAYNALTEEITTFATSLRVNARATSTQISASLLTAAPNQPVAPAPTSVLASSSTATIAATPAVAWPTATQPWPAMVNGNRLSGVWTMIESGLRRVYTGTVISSVERAYVYWPDGRVLMTMPSGGVMHPGETQFAGIDDGYWGRYSVRGNTLEMTWGTSGKQVYPLALTATNQLDRGTIRPAAPPVHDLRLRGTWEDVDFHGTRWIRFDEAGRFVTGPTPLPNRAGAGTYMIDGYAMLLRFDDGGSERLSFVALEPGPTPRTITLERQTLPLRR